MVGRDNGKLSNMTMRMQIILAVSGSGVLFLNGTVVQCQVKQSKSAGTKSPANTFVGKAQAVISEEDWRKQFAFWAAAHSKGDYPDAEKIMKAQLAKIDAEPAKYKKYLGESLSDLIKTEFALNKFAECKPLYERLLTVVKERYGPGSVEMAKALKSYALVCRRLGETEKSSQMQSQAEAILMHPVQAPMSMTGSAQKGAAGAAVSELKESDFASQVLGSKLPVLIDFYADWCGPCKHMSPLVDSAAASYSGRARVFRCNVDSNPGLAGQFGINSIPTFIVFKSGQRVANYTGTLSQDELNKLIDAGLR